MARYIDADKLIGQILLEKSAYEYRLSVMKERKLRNTDIEIMLRSSIDELGRCVKMVKQARAADVESVKHGEWSFAIGYDVNKKVKCSVCELMTYEPTDFCPHCGAKIDMKEGLVDD